MQTVTRANPAAPDLRLPWRMARRGLVRFAGSAMVAMALLPAILPYDHLLVHEEGENAQDSHDNHARHCHADPGGCADAPIGSGPGQFMTTDPLLVIPPMLDIPSIVSVPALREITRAPEPRPPRSPA